MKINLYIVSFIVILISCTGSKETIEEVEYEGSFEYVLGLIATQSFDEPVNFKYSSRITSDTLLPYSIDNYVPIEGSNGYEIDVAKEFEKKIKDFVDVKFSNLDSTSTTTVLVSLTDFDIREGNSNPYSTESLGVITTIATSFVVLEIYENNVKTFSQVLINDGFISGEKDNYKDSHIASIEAANESAILKLIEVFNTCNDITCVTLKDPITAVDGLEDIPVISYSSEGSLESFEPIEGCVSISELKNTNTPADILPSSRRCMDMEEYEKGIKLSIISRIYAFYDMQRVSDGSAHQAIFMLEEGAFQTLSGEQIENIEKTWEQYGTEGDSDFQENMY